MYDSSWRRWCSVTGSGSMNGGGGTQSSCPGERQCGDQDKQHGTTEQACEEANAKEQLAIVNGPLTNPFQITV